MSDNEREHKCESLLSNASPKNKKLIPRHFLLQRF